MTETTAPPSLPLVAGRWAFDAAHSNVGFTIRHLGVSKVRGRFADVQADLVIGETLAESSVQATIALASIDTGNADRDAHVRAPDMIDVATRPTMTFRSVEVRGAGSDWVVDGELTIGDVTRPITLDVELGGVGEFIDGSRHAGFEATCELSRKDFGLGWGAASTILGDKVKIELDLEFIEPT
ncbi:MAG TPA: YceI family protein [Acidimicrobiales bacterium]